jgi:hypothetical protein
MDKLLTAVVAAVLLPAAVLLLIAGVRIIRLDKRSGFSLRLALILNTSLAIVLGWFGCAKAEQPEISCYQIPAVTDEPVPKAFGESVGWDDLEKTMVELERKISANDFDGGKYDEFYERISKAQLKLAEEGILDQDELEVIGAYCSERLAWYLHMVGGATCYEPMPVPTGREATLGNIVARGMELRGLYAEGSVGDDAYDAAVLALEDVLREYTGDGDVSGLRQLILDLADGVKYE